MDDALRALADGTRRRIITLVRDGERTAGAIAGEFAVSRPAISQHLKVLLDSELLVVRRNGTRRLYRANRQGLDSVREMLEAFWDDRLARLKDVAEAAERQKGSNGT